ncbi:hypothetical protein DFAR_510006 [Desulfarculales bacterium]
MPSGRANSLRDLCQGLSYCLGKLSYLGVSAAPTRSTLSYANQNRPSPCSEPCSSKPWSASVLKAPWAEKGQVQTQEQAPEPGLLHHHPVPEPVPLD